MKVELKGDNLIITLPFNKDGAITKSKKSKTHATSNGNKPTEVMVDVDGQKRPLIVGVNAYTDAR